MAKKKADPRGPEPVFSTTRAKARISIVATPEQLEAAKKVAASKNPPQTVSTWGLYVILDALAKEGYTKW